MLKIKNITGNTYGLLTAIKFDCIKDKRTFWHCRCKCGKDIIVRVDSLPKRISCGCSLKTHGETIGNRVTKEYEAWSGMKARCYNPNNKRYKYYGARGIQVCERWLNSFDDFVNDVGRAPSPKHSIERNRVNGDYEPNNCRWATQKEQMNNTTSNRKITLNGVTKNLSQWCDELSLNYKIVHQRIQRGWPTERALV